MLLSVFISCTENSLDENFSKTSRLKEVGTSSKLNVTQAIAYASIFSSNLDEAEAVNGGTRSVPNGKKELDHIDYFIEEEDTLLYAFNYKNNSGFIIIAGDNSSFPIIAHSNEGNIDFDNIPKETPVYLLVTSYKNRIKEKIHNPESLQTEYYANRKDLGLEGYEYEIILTNGEPSDPVTRGRRKESSNKESIYPYTGKALDYWCQKGGYNYYAKNKAAIGCPAIATGMLLYDASQRILGNMTTTYPDFGYFDARDISTETKGTDTARKLREIADSIPNYNWGIGVDKPSGATPQNILTGLRKLGFKKAELVPYDFETLYKNLSFEGAWYGGNKLTYNRGVLIGAYAHNAFSGHIWFCDGYYEQSYTVKKKFLGIKVKSWTEYDDSLYMNWGWGPNKGNGWYSATDDVWTSLEGNPNVDYKYMTQMYINLSYYENPQNTY